MRFILVPGNGGCGDNIRAANWYGWFADEMEKRGHTCVLENWPDSRMARESIWMPHIKDNLKVDEETVVVGHSSGALLLMRLMETTKIKGGILVAAAHTDLGDENERASGYFDRPWDFAAMKTNASFIHQFHSVDDFLIPVEEGRYVAEQLACSKHTYTELEECNHFFEPFQQLLDVVDKHFPQ